MLKEQNKVIEYLRSAIDDFDQPVNITKSYDFNQSETINLITLYTFSQFETGHVDELGNYKYFYNIINPAVANAVKNIDIDTKHLLIKPKYSKDRLKAMLFNEASRNWMKNAHMSFLLNRFGEELPRYGSVIWKLTGDKIEQLKLDNVIFDPAVNNIPGSYDLRSPYIIEKIYLQPHELEKMSTKGWDKELVDKVLNEFRELKAHNASYHEILIYELHAEFPKAFFGEGEGYAFYRVYVSSMPNDDQLDKERLDTIQNVLYYNQEDKMPYKKIDFLTVIGRGLGLGVPETLFDAQLRMNVLENEKAVSMLLGSKTIFTTPDDIIERNIMTDVLNGDIVKSRGGLQAVQTDTRNLSAYAQVENTWGQQIRLLANMFEVTTGEQQKTNTPFKSTALLNEEASKFFVGVRENMGIFLAEVFNDWLFPIIAKDLKTNKGEYFEILNEDVVLLLQDALVDKGTRMYTKNTLLSTGFFPTEDELNRQKDKILKKVGNTFEVEYNEWIDGFEKELYVDATGESYMDNLENKMNLIQSMSQNIDAFSNPTLEALTDSALEDMGINYNVLNLKKRKQQMAAGQSAGRPTKIDSESLQDMMGTSENQPGSGILEQLIKP